MKDLMVFVNNKPGTHARELSLMAHGVVEFFDLEAQNSTRFFVNVFDDPGATHTQDFNPISSFEPSSGHFGSPSFFVGLSLAFGISLSLPFARRPLGEIFDEFGEELTREHDHFSFRGY